MTASKMRWEIADALFHFCVFDVANRYAEQGVIDTAGRG